jgi:hypothetical protein
MIFLVQILDRECLILDIGLCWIGWNYRHCNSRIFRCISNILILNQPGSDDESGVVAYWAFGNIRWDYPGWKYVGPTSFTVPLLNVSIRQFWMVFVRTVDWFIIVWSIALFTMSWSPLGSAVNVICWGPGRGFFLKTPLLV